ncbi:lysozyme inhibitor LprI family protein [Halomonas sp. PAMB 3264]|uniref:lysozyme inhibitor LprI family protein n=1 Tax=Halomonas sp. PAMB 3264 TaxID=3075222 RepID=UPI002898CD21|nr:lysozyme inhibitor LprI family protein [Halomonas sp. PAMB 3264]WNL43531.1 lysozyme inhibitor LprI family protein [Halomonas sp. PAMB 3264]
MKKRLGTSLLLLLSCLPCIALAQESTEGYTREYTDCMEAAGSVTQSMVECISDEVDVQDKRLNDAYRAIRRELPEARQIALRDAQRLWISYRDANCGFYATGEGTMARLISNDCFLSETAERATELENMVAH